MTAARARWILWLLFFALLPLPYWAIERGREPGLQLLVFALVTGAVALSEPSAMSAFVAGLFWLQMLLYACFFYLVAGAVVRRGSPRRRLLVLAAATLVLLGAALFPVYLTPFSRTGSQSNVIGLLP